MKWLYFEVTRREFIISFAPINYNEEPNYIWICKDENYLSIGIAMQAYSLANGFY